MTSPGVPGTPLLDIVTFWRMWMNRSPLPHALPGHWWPLQCEHSPGPAGCWGRPPTGSAAARAIGGPAPGCSRRRGIGVRPGPGGRCCCRCWLGGAASRAGHCPTLVRNCGSWSPGSFCRPRPPSWRTARMGSMVPFQIQIRSQQWSNPSEWDQ